MKEDFISSLEIHPYSFSSKGSAEYVLNKYMANSWPVVYIIKNDKIGEAYVGESTNALNRMKNHLANKERKRLNELLVISCDKFNKSAVLDIESKLISYMDADKHYKLQNANAGLVDHNYYQKTEYDYIFKKIWKMLLAEKYADNPIERLDNSDFFKYSPYKSLSYDQHQSVIEIITALNRKKENTIFVEGGAGTGKTVLAIYLMKLLNTEIQNHHLDETDEIYSEEIGRIIEFKNKVPNPKVALVVPMTSLRKTLKNVFGSVKGLKGSMVIGPSEVAKVEGKYDLLIVDEAHRLRKRKNITNFGSFDAINKKLGLDKYKGTELDWILMNSNHQIFFYDQGQSIKPSDIDVDRFKKAKWSASILNLVSQHRVQGGLDYINFIDSLLHCRLDSQGSIFHSTGYELVLFENLKHMHNTLIEKEKKLGLCRMLAGYSWPWESKKDSKASDIEIDGIKFKWNTTHIDWINSMNAINEIGCIHTSQGYDLNYGAIIFGNEISYDESLGRIKIDPSNYYDAKGKQGIKEPEKLKEYILNIYKTMMLRGIKGTYIYVCDPALRAYFKYFINVHKNT